ncbi:MAG: FtsX-like permease family protein [Anaerolineae bacterium]|nr:FtsX-like permease family protein [Anaerolineae bacterium]
MLQPLTDIYLKSKTQFETGITGNETTVRVLLVLGIIILVIVALNFINLSTSRSLTRAKEVGIRKAIGATRQNLLVQFLIETALINVIAGIVCILFIALLLPYFNELTQRYIVFADFLVSDLWKYISAFS